jgi:hypothetical protein
MWTHPFNLPPQSDSERITHIKKSADMEYLANQERKKRACNDIMCNFEYSQRCSQDPDKCDWWFEREIAAQERKREGDR